MDNIINMVTGPIVNLYGAEYTLSTKLRVAYKVQGQHGHKPYSEIFTRLDSMTLEDQIAILYASFEVANPDKAKDITFQKFLDWYLDNYDISVVMGQLQNIIGGILGKDLSDSSSEVSEGN